MRTLTFTVLVLLAGCAEEERVRVGNSPWYPLPVHARWIYKDVSPTRKDGAARPDLIRVVVKHEKIGAYPCALIANLRGTETPGKEHIYVTADGVFLAAVEGRRLSPPLRMLKLPPKAGDSWQTDLRENNALRKGIYVQDEEDVTVPAGTYRAVTLRGEISEAGVRTTDFKYWFAEGVGMVKQVVRKDGQTAVFELERFEKPF
jgi:hypothetical protein